MFSVSGRFFLSSDGRGVEPVPHPGHSTPLGRQPATLRISHAIGMHPLSTPTTSRRKPR